MNRAADQALGNFGVKNLKINPDGIMINDGNRLNSSVTVRALLLPPCQCSAFKSPLISEEYNIGHLWTLAPRQALYLVASDQDWDAKDKSGSGAGKISNMSVLQGASALDNHLLSFALDWPANKPSILSFCRCLPLSMCPISPSLSVIRS